MSEHDVDAELRRKVLERGDKIKPLAREAGVSYDTLWRWATGRNKRPLSLSDADKVWRALTGTGLMDAPQ
jgi:transposase-like protein